MSEHAGNELFIAARVARGWRTQQEFVDAYETQAGLMGEGVSISIRQLRRWESDRPTWPNHDARRVLKAMFNIPLEELGFVPLARPAGRASVTLELEDSVRRRTFLGVVAGAGATPLLDLPALDHLTAAVTDARRYADHALVDHLRVALDEAARADSLVGPRETLPRALGILSAIETTARDAQPDVRRDLLTLGARAAEFTAWLHRDAGSRPHTTLYWHDRAVEWATMTGDGAMHAYVLLRKAQAADATDGARMRDLAHAAHSGPWILPARPRAEALQQEARALAFTGAGVDEIDRVLDQAQAALSSAEPPAGPATCTGPLGDGYTEDRLMVQSALCYRISAQPDRAVAQFQRHLAVGTFAPRDRAFFTAALSGALAAAGEPDEAAATALQSLAVAAGAHFGQAIEEVRRTQLALRPHARRPRVRELYEGLAALTAA